MTFPASPPSQPPVRFGQASTSVGSAPGFGRSGAVAGLCAVLLLIGGLAWAAAAGRVAAAEHPMLFGGSLVLEDQRPLTVVDMATARVTVRLQAIDSAVGAASYGEVQAVPVAAGTILVNRRTGTFNLLAKDNYLVDTAGPGVGLGDLPGSTGASALGAGDGVYIVRYGPHATVSMVDQSTVEAGAMLEASGTSSPAGSPHASVARAVTPKGFADLGSPVTGSPAAAAVEPRSHDLWVLASAGTGCQVVQLHPVVFGHQGLLRTDRASFSAPCSKAAVEATAGEVAVATPGHIRLFERTGPLSGTDVLVRGSAGATGFLPVTGVADRLWFLASTRSGWSLLGVKRSGELIASASLRGLGFGSQPTVPALSAGSLYTLDQVASGQPTLWQILLPSGSMSPVRGAATYPARSRAEQANFEGAQVIADGPRVVFNNPGSLLAVVVFTDKSHPPVTVDKSEAVTVSASGPADLNIGSGVTAPGSTRTTTPAERPAVQPVSQQVTCANTTQKPYAPQITSVTPSSGTALISWSYQLLDQTDCEPDTWSARVTALSSGHQPDQPVLFINGQNQLLFTGLRPATTYQAVVTAYINTRSTPSQPVTFTTAARGPDAPTSVTTASDGKGDWVVTWAPCTASNCYVPADSWTVVGTACGSSYVGQPPAVQVPGNADSVTIDASSLGLLGDFLSFSVQGSLASGLTGDPTFDHACTEAWRPPDPSLITLNRSAAQSGDTITVKLQVSTNGSPTAAFGSQATDFVYRVAGVTEGPTPATSATVSGLAAGGTYTPAVEIFPANHPDAAVTVTGDPITPTLQWPTDMAVEAQPAVGSNPNQGTLSLSVVNLPSGPMALSGAYTCGSTQGPPFQGPLTNGSLGVTMDLVEFGGSCSVTVDVNDTDPAKPYGGTQSAPISGSFTIGSQPSYGFTAAFGRCQQSPCLSQPVEVDSVQTPFQFRGGGDWAVTACTKGDKDCAAKSADPCYLTQSISQIPPAFPYSFDLPASCITSQVDQVDVFISWKYLGVVTTADLGSPSGNPSPPPSTTTTTAPTSTTTPCPTTTSQPPPNTGCVAAASNLSRDAFRLAAAEANDASDLDALEVALASLVVASFMASLLRARGRVARQVGPGSRKATR